MSVTLTILLSAFRVRFGTLNDLLAKQRAAFLRRKCRQGGHVMTAFKKAVSRAIREQAHDVETFKMIAIFCGAGMVVSLFLAMRGLDMSAGLF
jgi:hypothetical protein